MRRKKNLAQKKLQKMRVLKRLALKPVLMKKVIHLNKIPRKPSRLKSKHLLRENPLLLRPTALRKKIQALMETNLALMYSLSIDYLLTV